MTDIGQMIYTGTNEYGNYACNIPNEVMQAFMNIAYTIFAV